MKRARTNDAAAVQAVADKSPLEGVESLPAVEMKQVCGGTVMPSTQFPRNDQKWNNYLFFGFYQGVHLNASG